MTHRLSSRAAGWLRTVAAAFLMARCGGSPTGPGGVAPSVASIDPSHGAAGGGTSVHITGDHFDTGALVAIGGVAATDVVIQSPTSILAVTGAHGTGAADVTVTVAGRSGTLPGAFTYDPGMSPTVTSIVARGSVPNEPENFADLDEEIAVTAVVDDPDTPADKLTYEWSADAGTFSGSGPIVMWRAPAEAQTPLVIPLTLTVSDGSNRVTVSHPVSVHNSRVEVGDLARNFLLDFSDSSKPAEYVVRNFSTSPRCAVERADELGQIKENRKLYLITSSFVGAPTVFFQFGGRPCSYQPRAGDACAAVPSTWDSTCVMSGGTCTPGRSDGTDYVTAVYEESKWLLCASYFQAKGAVRPSFIR